MYSKSNKQSPSVSNPAGSSNPKTKSIELEEAKLEVKRLKELLDRYKLNKNNPGHTQGEHSSSHHPSEHTQHNSSSSHPPDYLKKIKSLEENIRELHKSLNSKKQEETALLNDMEITGQAFEDMQVRNLRYFNVKNILRTCSYIPVNSLVPYMAHWAFGVTFF